MKLFRLQFGRRYLGTVAKVRQPLPIIFSLLYKRNFVHRFIPIVSLLIAFCTAFSQSSTQITDAKIASVTERGFILLVGSETLQVEDTGSTRFWKKKAVADRKDFGENDLVTVRIKTNVDPPEVREIADRDSWNWIDNIRKQPVAGTIEKIDSKYLTLKLSDGSSFAYRATEKSKVTMRDKPDCKLTDLQVGQKVYAKGRTLASLETWLAEITDTPIAAKPAKATTSKGAAKTTTKKPKALPASGKLEGMVLSHLVQYKMFDIVRDASTFHVTYTTTTKWTLDGKPAAVSSMNRDQKAQISYARDKFGRIIASKVELFSP